MNDIATKLVVNGRLVFRRQEVTVHSDKQAKKTWEELAAAASTETDPEKIAKIAEEIFAALEERERCSSSRPETNQQ